MLRQPHVRTILALVLASTIAVADRPAGAQQKDNWQTIEQQFKHLPMEARRQTGPLFWLHGDESAQLLTDYLAKVAAGGNGCFTAESRPHSDWLGEGWYRDLAVCLKAAKKFDLKMWIFDERWWPSGEVGGNVPQQYGSKYLKVVVTDVQGPLDLKQSDIQETLVAVLAGPVVGDGIDGTRLVDITNRVSNGTLAWQVPTGAWRIMVFHWEFSKGKSGRLLVDGASRDAVDWYINTVYQPHFDRFGDEFGKQIVGYFYDEPETLGDWGTEVIPMLKRRGIDWKKALVAWKLKLADDDQQIAAKYQYQDAQAEAWGETLYGGLTRWCHEHNVLSIGHFLEHRHEYIHPRPCAGNIMQLQKYSDMGAIDAIGRQFVPGRKDDSTYQTPKLGSSISHAYGKKDDLAMVEIFGARGQDISYPEIKWWTDVMHVAGTNFHIPHSFNPRSPYDRDCPPYFYNNGFEPRWPLYRVYADYTSRLSLLLTGGYHVCPVAFLFLGNSHHVGKSITPEDMTTALQDALFDCDWIPYDVFEHDMEITQGRLALRRERYRVLIVPAVEVIPYETLAKAKAFYESGGVVIGYAMLPSKSATLGKTSRDINRLRRAIWGDAEEVRLDVCQKNQAGGRSYFLPDKPSSRQIHQVLVDDAGIRPTLEVLDGKTDEWLHVLHRVKAGQDVLLICNQQHEGPTKTFRFRAHAKGFLACWDAMRGDIRSIPLDRVTEDCVDFTLTLEPLESVVLVFQPEPVNRPPRIGPAWRPALEPILVQRIKSPVQEPGIPKPKEKKNPRLAMEGCSWVWYPGDGNALSAPPGSRYFRKQIEIPAGAKVLEAKLRITADNSYRLFVNATEVGTGNNFNMLRTFDLTTMLRPGPNVLAIVASNGASEPNPAGLLSRYYIQLGDGTAIAQTIDQSWKCSDSESEGWKMPGFDDHHWPSAKNVAVFGARPWGKLDGSQMLTLSPVKADPLAGRFSLPQRWLDDSLRVYLETKMIEPENAAAVKINGEYVGGFIGKPNRIDITDRVKPGSNSVLIEPFAPRSVRVVAYSRKQVGAARAKNATGLSSDANLTVQLKLDPKVYSVTRYKKPPQLAIWLESPTDGAIRTLFVTEIMGRGGWKGKPTCPVSLPYWVSRYNKETNTSGDPTKERPVADAITQPTPTDQLSISTRVPAGSVWNCFVEVNVSGDFNDRFPNSFDDGSKDRFGNGQPSLVYRATIKAESGKHAVMKPIGRTGQLEPSAKLIADLDGITSAKKLLSAVGVEIE